MSKILTTDGVPLEESLKKVEQKNKFRAFLLVLPLLLFLVVAYVSYLSICMVLIHMCFSLAMQLFVCARLIVVYCKENSSCCKTDYFSSDQHMHTFFALICSFHICHQSVISSKCKMVKKYFQHVWINIINGRYLFKNV